MVITVLSENTTSYPQLGCEHGLSLHIDLGVHRLLFDLGQSGMFAENAAALGIDLQAVDAAVISHGHYDHGGGLQTFLSLNDHAPIYLSKRAFGEHYNAAGKYIGLDSAMKKESRLHLGAGTRRILPGVTLYDVCPRPHGVDSAGQSVLKNGCLCPEDYLHEQYLLVEEKGKRVLFSGCSHAGILNIAAYFRPDVLVGGFHFSKRPLDEALAADGRTLGQLGTAYYTGHCTGGRQLEFLRAYIPQLGELSVGGRIEI